MYIHLYSAQRLARVRLFGVSKALHTWWRFDILSRGRSFLSRRSGSRFLLVLFRRSRIQVQIILVLIYINESQSYDTLINLLACSVTE
jgi:hypothetical protein